MQIAYSGISGRIGFFINNCRSTSTVELSRSVFNWQAPDTYQNLDSFDRIFLSFPVNKINILELLPPLLSRLRPDQTIVKFGSLGPQRVIHDQIDCMLRTRCRVISLQLAPTMQNIMDEQIEGEYLCDYRYGRPAPYVAPEDAAKLAVVATEGTVNKDTLAVTGTENLTISDIQQLLSHRMLYKIKSIDPGAFVEQYQCYGPDVYQQIKQEYNSYKIWNPEPSTDLVDNNIYPLTFSQWLDYRNDN